MWQFVIMVIMKVFGVVERQIARKDRYEAVDGGYFFAEPMPEGDPRELLEKLRKQYHSTEIDSIFITTEKKSD
mgnify:CR=1 FL=1